MSAPRRRFSIDTYDPGSYDDNFSLKPPLLLWLAILFLSRALALPLVGGLTSMTGSADLASLTRTQTHPYAFLPALAAAVVLAALVRRVPAASRLTRFIWVHGRAILALSALGDLTLLIISLAIEPSGDSLSVTPQLVLTALDVFFLIYVLGSRRARDAFNDFPMPGNPPQ
jgi:hypothetical protein